MNDEKGISASLRVFTPESDASFVSEALGVDASLIHFRGTPINQRNPDGQKYPETIWNYDSQLSSTCDLHDHITAVIGPLEHNVVAIQRVQNRISRLDVFCMFSSPNGQGSVELEPKLIARLAALRLSLIIDLYPPSSD